MDSTDHVARSRMRAQRLWGRGSGSLADAVSELTAMQAQEHSYARWSVVQRTRSSPSSSEFDRAFDDGRVLRTHVLRPTWHYVSPADLRWLLALSGPRLHLRNARRYRELGLDSRTLGRGDDLIAGAVSGGPRTRRELGEELARGGVAVDGQRIAYLVMHAELNQVVCSGPVRGKQHTYAAFDERVPAGSGPEGDDALAELARRYFTARGPATLPDFGWWSGLARADARHGLDLAAVHLTSRAIDDRMYWFSDLTTPRVPAPRIDLVQIYDEVIIAYRLTRDVLQTPTVAFPVPRHVDGFAHVLLLDGRLLGHWRAITGREGLRVETRIDRSLDRAERDALSAAVDRYLRFVRG
jgi:hypothetical protein